MAQAPYQLGPGASKLLGWFAFGVQGCLQLGRVQIRWCGVAGCCSHWQGCSMTPDAAFQVAYIDVVVDQVHPLPFVTVTQGSRVDTIKKNSLFQVTEPRCRTGAFSSEWESLGFKVKLGVGQKEIWESLFQAMRPSSKADFFAAGAGPIITIRKMYGGGQILRVV